MEKVGYIKRVEPILTVERTARFTREWLEVTEELKRRMHVKRRDTEDRK